MKFLLLPIHISRFRMYSSPSIDPYLRKPPAYLETALPPINHQIRPIDITPRLRTQQHHRPRQLLRHTHPTHRVALAPRPSRDLEPFPLIEYRIHVAWRYGVHADAVHGPFSGQGALEADDGGFGGVVGGLGLGVVGAVGGDGGDEDD